MSILTDGQAEEWSAVAAWVGIAVSVLLSVLAMLLSLRSLRWEKESAEAASRSAGAAERANRLTEQLLVRDQLITRAPDEQRSRVAWSLERRGKHGYILRNVGSTTAEDVRVDGSRIRAAVNGLPDGAVVKPNASVEFLMLSTMGASVPNELYVTWRGHPDPEIVPIPR